MSDPVLTPEEVAAELGVHVGTVRRWVSAGELPAAKIGRRIFIRRSVIERLLTPEEMSRTV